MDKKDKNFEITNIDDQFMIIDDFDFDDDGIIEDEEIETTTVSDSVSQFFKSSNRYKVMTPEEELEYGKDLLIRDNINIYTNKPFIENTAEVIDLESIFASLEGNPYADDIINLLSVYFKNKESGIGLVVKKYLFEYKKYAKSIGRIPNSHELQEYFNDKSVTNRIGKMFSDFEDKDRVEDKELLKQVNDFIKYNKAYDRFVEGNLRLVAKIASRFKFEGSMDYNDIINEGNRGLMIAVKKFDVNKECKFSTYATWWIRQSITRAIADKEKLIRIPTHMIELMNKVRTCKRRLENELGRVPSSQEIADSLEISVERVWLAKRYDVKSVSLDVPIGDDSDSSLIDFLPDEDKDKIPENVTINEEFNEMVAKSLECLTPSQREVIMKRFGIGCERQTLEDIGKNYLNSNGKRTAVSRERIRQVESAALRKLRKYYGKNALDSEFFHTRTR